MPRPTGNGRSVLEACAAFSASIALAVMLAFCVASGVSHAQTVIESSNNTQRLSSDTDYILLQGTTASSRNNDAIIVNDIAPVTFTNAGVITNDRRLVGERSFDYATAIRFHATGSLLNQSTGVILGDDRGVFVDGARGYVNLAITNHGDISAGEGPAIAFSPNTGGAVDNFGTINSGDIGRFVDPLHHGGGGDGDSSSGIGILIDTHGTVTVNNHAGASIRSGFGPSPSAIVIRAGNHVIVNDGLIEGHRMGIEITSDGNQVTNRGTISSETGTAISFASSNNLLTLGTGSVLHGAAASFGANNRLRLEGTGSESSPMNGFTNLTMDGEAWTLGGTVTLTGNAPNTINVLRGTLTVTGSLAPSIGGGTMIASGAGLSIGAGGVTGSLQGSIIDNGVLTINRSDDVIFTNIVSGSGVLVKRGAGRTTLVAANSYSGGTRIEEGVLNVSHDVNLGAPTGGLTFDGGTLRVSNQFTTARTTTIAVGSGAIEVAGAGATFTGVLQGAYALRKTGSGALVLAADSTGYTGLVAIESGALRLGAGGTGGTIAGDVNNAGSLIFNRATDLVFGGTIQGGGSIIKDGNNTLTLSGNVSSRGLRGSAVEIHSGAVIVTGSLETSGEGIATVASGAALAIGDGGSTGVLIGNVDNHGSVTFNRSTDLTYEGGIFGPGSFDKQGAGTLTLLGELALTGDVVISGGALRQGDGGDRGTIGGRILNNATLIFDRSDSLTQVAPISGSGAVIQQGSGTVTLAGINTYSGLTSINAGRLDITGSIAGSVQVAAGGALGGNGGVIGGAVTVLAGGQVSPGASFGTLTMGSLVLNPGALLDFELGLPNIVGGTANDHIIVNGSLTLDGLLNISDEGGFSQGVYQLIHYSGAFTNNGLDLGALPDRFRETGSIIISTATPNEINLIVSAGAFGLQFWDGPGTSGNNVVDGGAGTWSPTGTNWTADDGIANGPWQGGFAVFQGAAGTVGLGGNMSFSGMQFRTDGYVIQGGSGFSLAYEPDAIIAVDQGKTARIEATIADGAGGGTQLVKEGDGTLILSGINTFTGGVNFDQGTLVVTTDANLGAATGGLIFDGATLRVGDGFTTARDVEIESEGGIIETAGATATFNGLIHGVGGLVKAGAGNLVLGGAANSYGGGTAILGGVLTVANDNLLGDLARGVLFNGGALNVGGGFSSARRLGLEDLGGGIDASGASATFSGVISGHGRLTKGASANTIILTGSNTYTGGTTISGGVLQLGAGGTTGSIVGDVLNNGTLIFNRSGPYQVANTISGTGGIAITGGGVAHILSRNSYRGETRITGGSTLIADFRETMGEPGAGSVFMAEDSTLVLNSSFSFVVPFRLQDTTQTFNTAGETTVTTISGLIDGAGRLRKTGLGALVLLNGANSYTGGTSIDEGVLSVVADGNLGAAAGGLALNGGALHVGDGFTTARGVTLDAGGGTITTLGAQATFSGVISGAGALTKTGVGELVLQGAGNTFAGGAFVNAGTLTVAADNLLGGAGGGLTLNGGALTVGDGFNSARGVTLGEGGGTIKLNGSSALFTGVLSGPGHLATFGAAGSTLILTGDNTFTGGVEIRSGVLQVGDGGTTGGILGEIINNGRLVFGRSDAYSVVNNILGTGGVTIRNGGVATMTGTNTFTGALRIVGPGGLPSPATTLVVEANINLGSSTGVIYLQDGGRLAFTQSANITREIEFAGTAPVTIDTRGGIVTAEGVVFGSAPLVKEGVGTLVLANTNSQTGGAIINAGALQIGGGVEAGTLNGDVVIAAGARLVFDRAGPVAFGNITGAGTRTAFGGTISGAGSVVQTGPGTLIALGPHTYTGGTFVLSGRLLMDGSVTGDAEIAAGARLAGTGSFEGRVTLADGALLEPGASVGTLTVGALELRAGSILNYQLGLPGVVGGGINDLTNVTGDLILDGTLNIADAGGFSRGVYRLINYGGALIDNGLLVGGLPTRFVPGDMLVSTATAGQVDLVVNAGGFGLQFWDGSNIVDNGIVDGGAGIWNNAAANWTAHDGLLNAPWQGGFAVFQGTAGVVTLGEPIAFEGMQFRTDGYSIESAGPGLAAATDTIIRVDASVNAAINAPIVDGAGGAARLTVVGPGTLSLGGSNTYGGGTVIDAGALRISADANLGAAAGALSLNGGVLITTATFGSGRTITLGEDGGGFSTDSATQLTLGGVIGGAGALHKTGTGTLVLTGVNTYAGGTVISAGVLAVSADANLGAATGALDLDGGTLRLDASFNPAASRPISITASGGTIDTNGHDAVLAQGVVGVGGLIKSGAGTLTLAGDNAYAGGTTITAGTLQIGSGGVTGGIFGDVVNNASLIFNRSDAVTFGGVISGAGSLTKLGGGTLTLTGDSTYDGGTTVGAGTLRIGDGGTGGSLVGNIVNNTALVFNRSDAVTFGGVISGAGTVSQTGAGTLTLGGTNTYSGGTVVSSGTIAVSSDLNLGAAGAGLTLDGGTLLTTAAVSSVRSISLAASGGTIDNGGFSDLLAGPVTGAGALTVTGAGTVTLTAGNTYAGGTTIAAGALRLGDGGTTGGIIGDVANNGVLVFQRSDLVFFDGLIGGGGAVVQAGTGTTVLTGSNSYTGGTTIAAGVLQIGNGGTDGAIAGDIANGGLLIFDRSDTLTHGGVISGAGSLLQAGAGTTVLTGANSYTGGTTISAGVLQIGDGGTAGDLTGNVVNNGVLVFNRADATAFAGTISGTGSLRQGGAGTLTVSGANSHTGGTIVSAGTLAVSSDPNLGAAGALLTLDGGRLLTIAGLSSQRGIQLGAAGGTIDNGGFASLFSGPVTGPGALNLAGSGAVTLTADSNHAGGTTIAAGTLRLGAGSTTGSVIGNVVNNGLLVFDRSNALAFGGVISGTGAVVQQGSGTTTLTAASTYAGLTSVNGGRLLVDGTISGAVTVASGARLGGVGGIGGVVTIADGARLAPGDGPGTLTLGSLLLSAGSHLDYELGLPDLFDAGLNDLINVGGALTLDGTLNLANAGGLGLGVYRLINYGGALTDNGLLLGAAPTGFSASDLTISTATAGEVNLIVSNGAGPGLQFWDGPNTVGNGIVDGGAAIWGTTATNWTGANGSANAAWRGGFAVFQGTAGTVTLGEPVTFEGMQFRTNGYRIQGGGFGLTAAGVTIVRVDPSVTATISAPITGAATLTKSGRGILVLEGANSYSGGTAINGGTIRVSADANLGAASGGLALDFGTLETTDSFASGRGVTLGENGGAFSIGAGTQLTLGGAITGAGQLGKTGAGTLVLTGLNSHAGGTLVTAGTLVVSSDSNLGAATGPLVLNGGALRLGASFDLAATRPVEFGDLGGTIDTGGYVSTVAHGIAGTGALNKQGSGVLILAGANSYSGGTTISAGTLRIGNGGATGDLVGDIINNGSLVFDRANQISFAGAISGAGSVTQAGPGTTVLTGANSYAGGTLISAGTLQIGNGGTQGSIAGDVIDNGTLAFNRSDDVTFAGAITGAGGLRQEGGGTLTLSGANSYTGATTVVRGQLEVAGSLGGSGVTIASGATLSGGGSIAGSVTIGDGARLAPGPLVAPGSLSVGALTLAPDARLDWRLGRPNIVGGRLNDIVHVAGDLILDGRLNITSTSDFATLPGTYRLFDYGGALTDRGLTLGILPDRFSATQVQTAIAGQVNLVAIRDGLALQFWDGGDGLGDGQVDGGTGVWSLAGTNWTTPNGAINQQWVSSMAVFAASGGVVTLGDDVSAVALQFASDGYRIQGGRTLTFLTHASGVGGLVRVDPSATAEIAAVIAGTAGLTKSDAGTLILTGANTYSGGTTIRGGILQIGAGGTSGAIGGDVENDSRLVFNRSDSVTFAGVISGLGAVEQVGGGVLNLTGSNSYSGGTRVRAGVLQITRDANIGGATSALMLDSGTLRWAAGFDLLATRPIMLGVGGGLFDTNGFSSTISQGVGGPGGLVKLGAGRLTLAGQSDYAGPTSIMTGELSINGSIRSATTVGPDGTLSGVGAIFARLTNRGRVAPGNSIGTFTVNGDYVGEGGVLEIETVLGADDSPSDRLIIAGGIATGSTTVNVLNLGGEGALTTGDGILVVDAANGGTTTAGAFTLAAPLLAGPYEYLLVRGGATASTSAADDWFLRSTAEDGEGGQVPSYRPETSLYATLPAMALTYGRSLVGTLHERVGEASGAHADRAHGDAVWSRVLLREGEREGENGILGDGPRYEYDFYAVQMGVDLVRNSSERGEEYAGVYAAYGAGDGDVRHFTQVRAGGDELNAYTVGAYLTRYTPSGWYLDGVVQGSWYDMEAESARLGTVSTHGFGAALSIETGRAVQTGGVTVEPQAQLMFQTMSLDDMADVAAQVHFEDMDSLAGRVGVRIADTWVQDNGGAVTLWGRTNLWYEFRGDTKTEFSSAVGSVPLHANLGGEWVEFEAGVAAEVTDSLSLHANVRYETDFDGRQHSYGIQAGLQLRW